MRPLVTIGVLALAGLGGCAGLLAGSAPPRPQSEAAGEERPPAPPVAATPDERKPLAPAKLEPHDPRTIPGGLACLIRLRALGIEFSSISSLKGVMTPVRVTGAIGGIALRGMGGGPKPLVCDCRLALALHRAAPYLTNLGVSELRFSNAYSYRLMPSGRLSQHAMGLAIDVHAVRADGALLEVKQDFALALEDGCAGPPLNRMACLLRSWGLFDWVLTPDFDRAHYNHFHLDIYDLHRRKHVPKDAPALASDD
jgi:hypothetical protein